MAKSSWYGDAGLSFAPTASAVLSSCYLMKSSSSCLGTVLTLLRGRSVANQKSLTSVYTLAIPVMLSGHLYATPNVSTYAYLSGPFDYNKMPLASMGCEAQVHENTDKCGTWAYRILWMDGICSHHPNIIAHMTATSSTPRVNDYPTLFNSNTSASPIPPSPMPTK